MPPPFIVFFSLFFCFVVVLVIKNYRQRVATIKHGVRVQGEVVDLKIKGVQLLYRYPVVRFETPEGQYLTLESMSRVPLSELKQGQKVEIRYPKSDPKQFIIVSGLDLLFD
jgi:hypothetical protein